MLSQRITNPVRVAIIGAGSRAINFCSFISKNADKAILIAMADTNTEKAQILNKYYNLNARIYDSFQPIVEDESIEAVLISTPDYIHVAPASAALRADKHVYLEKPLAVTVADCDEIIDVAKYSNSICYLGFNLRHSPLYENIHNLINAGKIGKIVTIEANEWYYGGKTYFRRWNRFRKFGGGLWLTKACHDFDLINWMTGGKPESIYATSNLSHYKSIENGGERCSNCIIKDTCPDYYDINKILDDEHSEIWRQLQLTMEQDTNSSPDVCLFNSEKDTFDNGIAVVNYDNDIRATYTVNVLAARNTRQMRIIGTEGMIESDTENAIITLTQRHTNKMMKYDLSKQTDGSHAGADERILADFFYVCRNGGIPRSGLIDGRLAVAVSLAAQESDDNNRVIKIP